MKYKSNGKLFAIMMIVFLVATIFSSAYIEGVTFDPRASDSTDRNAQASQARGVESHYLNQQSTLPNDYNARGGNEPSSDRYYRYSGSGEGQYFGSSGFGAGYYSYQSRPSYQTYYGEHAATYWPMIGDQQTCQARQDIMLNVAPIGCQPAVVRSDLLAEQNVPVFCQVDAFKVNPLIDIKQIRNIRFSGQYPPEVIGSGFHPARAALRTYDRLLGSPLINNVGYVVVVLKRQPDEKKLPDFVEVSLSAQIDYVSKNAYGIGRTEFLLTPVQTEGEWQTERLKQSFWDGRYSLRLESVNSEFADVSIYEGIRKISTARVLVGRPSPDIFVPGLYCRAGLQVDYDGLTPVRNIATLEVSSGNGFDRFDVSEGSKFLDGRCSVGDIIIDSKNKSFGAGRVAVRCTGYRFDLELKSRTGSLFAKFTEGMNVLPEEEKNGEYKLDLSKIKDSNRRGIYYLNSKNEFLKANVTGSEKIVLIETNGEASEVGKKDTVWLKDLRNALIDFRLKSQKDPSYGYNFLRDNELDPETKRYFDEAIGSYEKIAEDYPYENNGTYGERGLKEAIDLSGTLGMSATKARLITKLIQTYPSTFYNESLKLELERIALIDSSTSAMAVPFEEGTRTIRLLDIKTPIEDANVRVNINGVSKEMKYGTNETLLGLDRNPKGKFVLEDIRIDQATFRAYCANSRGQISSTGREYILFVGKEAVRVCDEVPVKVERLEAKQFAKIRLTPKVDGTRSESNFSVRIGIEKRAIQLSTDKALQKIENLNKSIEKWEILSEKLGKVVEGMKTACFGTAAALTFKNFLSSLSGGAIARQEVMGGDKGWRNVCAQETAKGTYVSIDACYLANAGKIDGEVSAMTDAINKVNDKIKPLQDAHTASSGIFGKSVNTDALEKDLVNKAINDYGSRDLDVKGLEGWDKDKAKLSELLEKNKGHDVITVDEARSLMLYSELKDNEQLTDSQRLNIESKMKGVAKRINNDIIIDTKLKEDNQLREKGFAPQFYATAEGQRERVAPVVSISNNLRSNVGFTSDVTHTSTVIVAGSSIGDKKETGFSSGRYLLGLHEDDPITKSYSVKEIYYENGTGYSKVPDPNVFISQYGIGNIKSSDASYELNEIASQDRECRFYENEPYKGMPAIVPFDIRGGWYAATRQNLPVFGGIGAFDSSGRVTSFWICNVGDNARIEFETGFGDDLCQQVNLQTGQPLGVFPGKSETEARVLVSQAIRSIEDASRGYGGGEYINVAGSLCKVGKPSIGVPETQCQDFMSPKDCLLLFNVCDPVICPNSRCDFGGKFPVANVPQTGIVGSALLCLPNIREGIAIPVCLTGIKSGIEGWVSIMKNYRDCLQANIDTGETIGICDEIHSIYLCDFFWNQVAPFANVLIPKLVEIAYGQGTRGGGEYLTVNAAWQNMQKSVNYFTQSYAVNSLKAFQTRSGGGNLLGSSISEIGTEVCKGFISAKAPKAFESLVEADSPPQFHAWFDARKFSDVTVPATAQYKVFYHIYAGKDAGVNYLVYLKTPPEGGYYSVAPRVQVATGFIQRGEYATKTVDFTAPEGYKELCVRIDDQEECGFKQVSTSFAVNYLKDSFVSEEIKNAGITSEQQCIGGSPNVGNLLNPNLQAGVEDTAFPSAYERGVVRICGSQNPGMSTDPSRFVDVGYCSDEKIRCWLDKTSVERAITDNNLLVKNETLSTLDARTQQNLESDGQVFGEGQGSGEIFTLEEAFKDVEKSKDVFSEAPPLVERIDFVLDRLVLNSDKARLLLLRAQIYKTLALRRAATLSAQNLPKGDVSVSVPPSESSDSGTNIENNNEGEENTAIVLSFGTKAQDGLYTILIGEGASDYYIRLVEGENPKILYESPESELLEEVGQLTDESNTIILTDEGRSILGDKAFEIEGKVVEGFEFLSEGGNVVSVDKNNEGKIKVDGVIRGKLKIVNSQLVLLLSDGTSYIVKGFNSASGKIQATENDKLAFEDAGVELESVNGATPKGYESTSGEDYIEGFYSSQPEGGFGNIRVFFNGEPTKIYYNLDQVYVDTNINIGFIYQGKINYKRSYLSKVSDSATLQHLNNLNGIYTTKIHDGTFNGRIQTEVASNEPENSVEAREEWTLPAALEEAKKRNGKYSNNKEFIDQLRKDGRITEEEYIEIRGDGIFNLEDDMRDVVKLLESKLPKEETEEPVEEVKDHYYSTYYLSVDSNGCNKGCKRIYFGKGNFEEDEYTNIYVVADERIYVEESTLVGRVGSEGNVLDISVEGATKHLDCLNGKKYDDLASENNPKGVPACE